jgi:hypothetical protein
VSRDKRLGTEQRTWLTETDGSAKNDGSGGGSADVDRALRLLCGRDGVDCGVFDTQSLSGDGERARFVEDRGCMAEF